MIGAIIGDLAAWTWEHNQECFYKQLVSPDAKFSGYGMLALELWEPIHMRLTTTQTKDKKYGVFYYIVPTY